MSVDDIRDELESDFDFYRDDDWEYEEETETSTTILGMTPPQRFVIAFLIFFTVAIMSVFCLLVTGKVALPL